MRKSIFKKLVTAVVTTAMAVSAMVAMPTVAKADTTKDVYLVAEEGSYSIAVWNAYGFSTTATTTETWFKYNMEKADDGLYVLEITTADDAWTDGIEISDGTNTYKVYTTADSWGVEAEMANWSAVEAALKGTDDVYLAIDTDNWTIKLTEAPKTETTTAETTTKADETETTTKAETETTTKADETETTKTEAETTTKANTTNNDSNVPSGDTAAVAALAVVAIVAAAVVLKKRTVSE